MIDLRVVKVGIEVDGKLQVYKDLKVIANGTKFANPLQNECTIAITGLNSETRNHILSQANSKDKKDKPARIILEVGRKIKGTFTLFVGDIVSAEVGLPPDVTLTIKAKTNNANNAKIVVTDGQAMRKLSEIADIVAKNNGVGLQFEATDKNIANYSFTGAASHQIRHLQEAGNVKAFIDDKMLIVKDSDKAAEGRRRILTGESGMIGIPKMTDTGIEVTYLIDRESELGGQLTIDSKLNQQANGDYIIEQLKFVAATHDNPFFYTAICKRL